MLFISPSKINVIIVGLVISFIIALIFGRLIKKNSSSKN